MLASVGAPTSEGRSTAIKRRPDSSHRASVWPTLLVAGRADPPTSFDLGAARGHVIARGGLADVALSHPLTPSPTEHRVAASPRHLSPLEVI